MAKFNREELDHFLGTVRKYMQVRGGLSQKDLAELTGIGVSTISRFLNQKTKELDGQLIANIVARLNVPLHEVIDFIAEDSEIKFKKMVQFYKELSATDIEAMSEEASKLNSEDEDFEDESDDIEIEEEGHMDSFSAALGGASSGTAKRNVTANVKIGGKTRSIPFNQEAKNESIREKLDALSPRQRAYLTDFLNLDVEGRDLVVDLGNSLFRYFRQRGMEL